MKLLVGWQEGHPACKKLEWWRAGVDICLERGADLHMAQLMPLPLTVSCFSKIRIGVTFLVLAHPGSPRQRAIKCVCVCACVSTQDIQGYCHLRNYSSEDNNVFGGVEKSAKNAPLIKHFSRSTSLELFQCTGKCPLGAQQASVQHSSVGLITQVWTDKNFTKI